jgi:glyoxylase-like metal-dependent hydrolase (beta-lactamase superfamily II)
MIRTELEKDFWLYQIPAIEENRLGLNICVLVDDKKVLLIDAGYERECQEVLDDLEKRHLEVVKVLPTHFHPDHVQGLFLMNQPIVYGHPLAKNTLKRFYEEDEMKVLSPTKIIEDQEIIEFGAFKIRCFYTPGHSDCSLLFVINNQYVHFGDLYIKMDDGRDVLPYVSWAGVEDHLKSFGKMKDHQDKTILISHGLCPVKKEDFIIGIKDRETYLQALLKSNNEIPAKEAVEGCKRPFEMMKWREAVR